MTFEVHIYAPFEREQPSRPIATVVLSDQREEACWLPERLAPEAWFFLARVEAESEDVEHQIRSVLQRPFLTVLKSSTHISGRLRTRGDYRAQEPYGTPTYWRAAIGRLKSEAGLIYDLQDYGAMLQGIETNHLQSRRQTSQIVEAAAPTRKERLSAALSHLASVRHDLRERLTPWLEQLERGAVSAEAALRAVVTAGRNGTVEVLRAMSHPSLDAAPAGMDLRAKRDETVSESEPASAIVITTDAVPSAKVAVEGDAVVVTFLDWQAPSPPLIVLVPEDERSEPRTPDHLEGEDGAWTARFERVAAGVYLLAVAPVNK